MEMKNKLKALLKAAFCDEIILVQFKHDEFKKKN